MVNGELLLTYLFWLMCRTYNGLLIGIQGEEDRTKEWYVKATSEQAQLMGQISVLYFSFTILISAFLLMWYALSKSYLLFLVKDSRDKSFISLSELLQVSANIILRLWIDLFLTNLYLYFICWSVTKNIHKTMLLDFRNFKFQ